MCLPFPALGCGRRAVVQHTALSVKNVAQGSRRLHALLFYMNQATLSPFTGQFAEQQAL